MRKKRRNDRKKVCGSSEEIVGKRKTNIIQILENIYLNFVNMKDYKKKMISNENMLQEFYLF